MLVLIQGFGGIYFENKIMATLFCSTVTNTKYMRVVSVIPHSYLVHFELVQTCCLLSYAMHILYFDHTHTHQPLSVMNSLTKAHHPPETKENK